MIIYTVNVYAKKYIPSIYSHIYSRLIKDLWKSSRHVDCLLGSEVHQRWLSENRSCLLLYSGLFFFLVVFFSLFFFFCLGYGCLKLLFCFFRILFCRSLLLGNCSQVCTSPVTFQRHITGGPNNQDTR